VCMTRSVDELVVGLAVGIWQLPDLRSEHGAFEVVLGPILWAALAAVAIFLKLHARMHGFRVQKAKGSGHPVWISMDEPSSIGGRWLIRWRGSRVAVGSTFGMEFMESYMTQFSDHPSCSSISLSGPAAKMDGRTPGPVDRGVPCSCIHESMTMTMNSGLTFHTPSSMDG